MSAWLGIAIAAITIGSCYASYRLGQENILHRFREYSRKRQQISPEKTETKTKTENK